MKNSPIGNAASFVVTPTHSTTLSSATALTAKEQFHQKINAWRDAAAPDSGEQRAVAAKRIEDAYERNARDLHLGMLRLASLPDLEGLTNLQTLSLSNNQLSTLSDKAFEGLTNLQTLSLYNNQLSTLSDLSEFIGELTNLRILNLVNNRLTSIPENLLRLPATCEVSLENNRFSEAVIAQLSAAANAPDYAGPRILFSMATASDQGHVAVPLSNAVAKWYEQSAQGSAAFSKDAWAEIGKEDSARDFSIFLERLHNTVNSTDPTFRKQIVDWLTRLAGNSALRKEIFLEAREGIASCEDRVSLTLNSMKQREITLSVMRGDYDNRLDQLIPLARQQYRLNELAKIAYAKVQTLRFVDEIDVHLAYQVKLRETLALALDTRDMRFFGVAHVTQDDLQTAALQVKQNENQHFPSYLANDWTPWQSVLQRLDPKGYETLQDDIYEAKTNQLTDTQNALLAERNLPATEGNLLNVTSEALQIIANQHNQTFNKAFLQAQENKPSGTPGLSALLNPPWEI